MAISQVHTSSSLPPGTSYSSQSSCLRTFRAHRWTIVICLACPYTRRVHSSKPTDFQLKLYCPYCLPMSVPSIKDRMDIVRLTVEEEKRDERRPMNLLTTESVWGCWRCDELNYFMEGNEGCENCGWRRGSECVVERIAVGLLEQEVRMPA